MDKFLFGFRSTTYKTSYDVSWKTYEADVKDLQSSSSVSSQKCSIGTIYISLQNILIPTETTWNDYRYKSHSVACA